jgi:hypothetical protein
MPNNRELLRTQAFLDLHPELLDMSVWLPHCGTACCYAGNTLALAGIPAAYVEARRDGAPTTTLAAVRMEDLPGALVFTVAASLEDPDPARRCPVYHGVQEPGQRYVSVPAVAQMLLGLTVAEADRLFDPTNTHEKAREIVGELCAAAPAGSAA